MNRHALFQDPHHPYAIRFMELLFYKYGMRSVCFYTDVRERIRHQRKYSTLNSDIVSAAYDVKSARLLDLAVHLKNEFEIAAVIPFNEDTLLNAIELSRYFGLGWCQPALMRRFRDKFAMKDFLRKEYPKIRMTASERVYKLSDIKAMIKTIQSDKFVLKPNSGYGNRSIGVFDVKADDSLLTGYLSSQYGASIVMEEFIGGDEYFVNGQVDGAGNVSIVAVFEYMRIAANQRHNLDYETRRVMSTDSRFTTLTEYAVEVMKATGLKRSPFHMEIKLDNQGPCLIEVGARLAGHGNAEVCGKMHGNLDLFDLAAHYYLSNMDYGPVPIDWDRYDAADVRYIHGIAERRERIHTIHGISEIESMPEFMLWAKKPEVGTMQERTVDCLTMPWSAVVCASDTNTAAALLRKKLSLNPNASTFHKAISNIGSKLRHYGAALRIRFLASLKSSDRYYSRIKQYPTVNDSLHVVTLKFNFIFQRLAYTFQLWGFRLPLSSSRVRDHEDRSAQTAEVLNWARGYLAQPHPLLRRKGAVCPFVQHTINRGNFIVAFYGDVKGNQMLRIRRVILDEARNFQRRFPRNIHKSMFSSVLIVFSNLAGEDAWLVELAHDELKTHLMKSDLMCSPFHPNCTRPSITNSEFEVLRAPFAGFVIRHMSEHDIAFVGHNREAFLRYQALFGELYSRGEMDNDHGYVDMYQQACALIATNKVENNNSSFSR